MQLSYYEFFAKYPGQRGKGKQYGGHCVYYPQLVRRLERVLRALSKQQKFDYYVENANCDMYIQRVIYVGK